LHIAAMDEKKTLCEKLISAGSNLSAKDIDGLTPLHFCSKGLNLNVAVLLLEKGADVLAKDNKGLTPCMVAVDYINMDEAMEKMYEAAEEIERGQAERKAKRIELGIERPPRLSEFDALVAEMEARREEDRRKDRAEHRILMAKRMPVRRKMVSLLESAEMARASGKPFVNLLQPEQAHENSDEKARSEAPCKSLDFAGRAAIGSAWMRLPILGIPTVIAELNKQMEGLGLPSEAMQDLYNNSLLAVCPQCNQYCAGKAFLSVVWLVGPSKVTFTGDSGGFERMLEGRCLNYNCLSTEFDLFWCPDLDPTMFKNLKERGINLDPNIQRKRDPFWKPKG